VKGGYDYVNVKVILRLNDEKKVYDVNCFKRGRFNKGVKEGE
jgi:hypothetical protein